MHTITVCKNIICSFKYICHPIHDVYITPATCQQSSLLMYQVARSPTLFLDPHGHQLSKIGLVYEAPIWYSLSLCYTVCYLHTHWIIKTHSISRASSPRWRHQMETLSALLAHCPVTGEFPTQRPVTRNFDVFFDLRVNLRRQRAHYGVIVMQYKYGCLRHGDSNYKDNTTGRQYYYYSRNSYTCITSSCWDELLGPICKFETNLGSSLQIWDEALKII